MDKLQVVGPQKTNRSFPLIKSGESVNPKLAAIFPVEFTENKADQGPGLDLNVSLLVAERIF